MVFFSSSTSFPNTSSNWFLLLRFTLSLLPSGLEKKFVMQSSGELRIKSFRKGVNLQILLQLWSYIQRFRLIVLRLSSVHSYQSHFSQYKYHFRKSLTYYQEYVSRSCLLTSSTSLLSFQGTSTPLRLGNRRFAQNVCYVTFFMGLSSYLSFLCLVRSLSFSADGLKKVASIRTNRLGPEKVVVKQGKSRR